MPDPTQPQRAMVDEFFERERIAAPMMRVIPESSFQELDRIAGSLDRIASALERIAFVVDVATDGAHLLERMLNRIRQRP
jgi:hypothetical protein